MTTNDPQAGYEPAKYNPCDYGEDRTTDHIIVLPRMDNPSTEKREPLLSLAHFNRNDMCAFTVVEKVRDFYENLITSGELMVSKTATLIPGKYGGVECSQCGRDYPNPGVDPNSLNVGEFCRCGARIIE